MPPGFVGRFRRSRCGSGFIICQLGWRGRKLLSVTPGRHPPKQNIVAVEASAKAPGSSCCFSTMHPSEPVPVSSPTSTGSATPWTDGLRSARPERAPMLAASDSPGKAAPTCSFPRLTCLRPDGWAFVCGASSVFFTSNCLGLAYAIFCLSRHSLLSKGRRSVELRALASAIRSGLSSSSSAVSTTSFGSLSE